jgi:hypothetical protein
MQTEAEFSRAQSDWPPSNNSQQLAPLAWCIIVVVTVATATWFALSP